MRELSAQLTEGEKSLIHFDLPSGNPFLESLRLFGDKSPKIHLPLGKGGYPPGYLFAAGVPPRVLLRYAQGAAPALQ